MPHDDLGLFDTPPTRLEVALGLTIVGMLIAGVLLILPGHAAQLPEISAFVPTINAIMLVAELVIATVLFTQANISRSRALTVLASGYVFAALLLVPHALTFPGAFAARGLLDAGVDTTGWIAIARRVALPSAFILYACLKAADNSDQPADERRGQGILLPLSAAIGSAAAVTLLATAGHNLLPPLFLDRSAGIYSHLVVVNVVTITLTGIAMALLLRQSKSVLDIWLLVALSAWLLQSLLNLPIDARFTLGWYGLFVIMLVSDLVLMLALITEFNRLYARLALTTAARNLERESRLMSMDALAAAIAHEVGQPLSAVKLNANAGLAWLAHSPPNVAKATIALQGSIEAIHRSLDVITSVRGMFTKKRGTMTQFSLNDLVRETAVTLEGALAGRKVSLQLALDDALLPIVANRIQLQEVLINLFTNAIEALDKNGRRARRVDIRSAALNGKSVLLEISDTGTGIEPDKMTKIFEPFFTTKETGTGLGLPLCRTIVEEHGGRLWASHGVERGATFHLQLPVGA